MTTPTQTIFPGQIWYADSDSDGFGNPNNSITSCTTPNNTVLDNTDCDDTNASYFPGQTWYSDNDGDGFGDASSSLVSCLPPSNGTLDTNDCDDSDGSIYPSAPELCDGQVNTCGGSLPSDEVDDDGDGYVECVVDGNGWDGSSINGGEDCDDTNGSTFPGAFETIGDEVDSDCDGGEICILDADDDGHGNENGLTQISSDSDCSDPNEVLASNTDDCDDLNALYNPTLGCYGADCADILSSGWSTGDGVYSIDPDGSGGSAPYDVYCDMTTDGGGWMRITHLHSNRDIGSIKRNTPFFTAAWQQNSASFTNTSNANLVLDNSTYGMLDSTAFPSECNRCSAHLQRHNKKPERQSHLDTFIIPAQSVASRRYRSKRIPNLSLYRLTFEKHGSSFSNANVYFSHTENAFSGSWHVCGTLSSTSGGFQLGLPHRSLNARYQHQQRQSNHAGIP